MPSTPEPRLSAEEIDARTPAARNRYADALRLGSLAVVVLGHWTIAVVTLDDGRLSGGSLLLFEPWTRWATWVFQVMPVFFFVGGYANAIGCRTARERGDPPAQFIRRRARRLLRPAVPVLALWVLLVMALAAAGVREGLLHLAGQNAIVPVWFLAVYLVVVALAPWTYRLHERFGVAVLVAGAVGALCVDALHRAGVPLVGWLNFVLVWGTIHQAGYLWHDRLLPRRRGAALGLAGAGLAVVVVLTQLAGYPVGMVGVEGVPANTSPPSAALLGLAALQVGVALVARPAAERLLARPRVWATMVRVGAVTMALFLWHMTAMLVAAVLLYPTGALYPAPGSPDATWWAQRPLWLIACAVVLALLLPVTVRFERSSPPRPRRSVTAALIGVAATTTGLTVLLLQGIHDPDALLGVPLPWVLLLGAGLAALGVLGRGQDDAPASRRTAT